jgi:hypothetical protein
MKVIGAGFGRSGTMSLQKALEILGFGPCYHMQIALKRPWHLRFFLRAWQGRPADWKRFFRNYVSTVDWPACSFYRELSSTFPDAKIILNVRDPEKWYQSMMGSIWAIQPAFPWWFPKIVRKIHDEIIWKGNLKNSFPDRGKAIASYLDWIDEVKSHFPSEKLLVYNVSEGWEPLCSYLNVPVPNESFPHLNDRNSFTRLIRLLRLLNWLVPLVIFSMVIFLGLYFWFLM